MGSEQDDLAFIQRSQEREGISKFFEQEETDLNVVEKGEVSFPDSTVGIGQKLNLGQVSAAMGAGASVTSAFNLAAASAADIAKTGAGKGKGMLAGAYSSMNVTCRLWFNSLCEYVHLFSKG